MIEELQCFAFNYKELYRTSISSASNQEENNYWLGNQSILGDQVKCSEELLENEELLKNACFPPI